MIIFLLGPANMKIQFFKELSRQLVRSDDESVYLYFLCRVLTLISKRGIDFHVDLKLFNNSNQFVYPMDTHKP